MPGWRNGLRRGLKILDPKGFVGSIPTPGTREVQSVFSEKFNRDARSASLSVVGVIKILRPRRERFEPKNFLCGRFLVPRVGLEPTRPYGHTILSRDRLPVPTPGRCH